MQGLRTIFLGLLLIAAADAVAEEQVRQYSGDRSTQTPEFDVEGPWLIDWRVNSEYPGSMGFGIDLVRAGRGTHEGRVVKTKSPGNGVRLVQEGGRYYFKVDAAVAYWTIKVIQLTPEEARLYTPKSSSPLD